MQCFCKEGVRENGVPSVSGIGKLLIGRKKIEPSGKCAFFKIAHPFFQVRAAPQCTLRQGQIGVGALNSGLFSGLAVPMENGETGWGRSRLMNRGIGAW